MTSGGKLKPVQAILDVRHYTINLDVDIERKTKKGKIGDVAFKKGIQSYVELVKMDN